MLRGFQELGVQLLLLDVNVVDVTKDLVQGLCIDIRYLDELDAILINLISDKI
jgi:hypothetical protein